MSGTSQNQSGVGQTFTVSSEEAGQRLDRLLQGRYPEQSRSFLQKLIQDGHATLNGATVKTGAKVQEGQTIQISIPEAAPAASAAPEDIPIDIVYEDDDILVVNKPKGMATHPAAGTPTGTLVNAVMAHCGSLSKIGGVLRPGIVHRLDKDTSGLLVIAKNDRAHNHLAKQIKRHEIQRTYIAVVHGSVKDDAGEIAAPIGRNPKDRKKMAVIEPGKIRRRWHHLPRGFFAKEDQFPEGKAPRSREAMTRFKVLKRLPDYTVLEVQLETGRTHQIRVHMAYIHHPVVGDQSYGRRSNTLGATTQMLHSARLELYHPRTGEPLSFSSEPPFADSISL